MPYRVRLHLLDSEQVDLHEVHGGRTPQKGDEITVSVGHGTKRAKVIGIRTPPPRSPEPGVETVVEVDAKEM